jgi:hypothetical protein
VFKAPKGAFKNRVGKQDHRIKADGLKSIERDKKVIAKQTKIKIEDVG